MRQPGGLQLGDRLLNHGVATVLALDLQQVAMGRCRISAASTARSAQSGRGLGLVRRSTGDLVPEDEQLDVFGSRCAPSSNSQPCGVLEVGLSLCLRRSTSSTTSCR